MVCPERVQRKKIVFKLTNYVAEKDKLEMHQTMQMWHENKDEIIFLSLNCCLVTAQNIKTVITYLQMPRNILPVLYTHTSTS